MPYESFVGMPGDRWNVQIPPSHPIVCFIAEYAGFLINRFEVGHDDTSPRHNNGRGYFDEGYGPESQNFHGSIRRHMLKLTTAIKITQEYKHKV